MTMTEIEMIPVLLVDDRAENLTALEGLLDGMEIVLFKASSGNEALSLSLKHDFAIVLMDVRMPDMDGFETAELMRANPKTSRLPIIFVTAAMKDTEHQFKGYETGALDYLLKPIEPVMLRSKVRVFCDLYRQRLRLEKHEQQLETLVKERTAELHKTLEGQQESEKRFRELLTSVTSYMYTVSLAGDRVVSTLHGPGCLAVTGYSAEEYAADPDLWCRMIHPEDRQAVLAAAGQLLTAKSAATFEHRIQHQDDSIRWVRTTLVPQLDPAGELLSYDGAVTDITERKRAEEEILKLNQELEQRVAERTAQLQTSNKELEAFCYSISHDLRAPLRHLDGYVELLVRRCRTDLDDKELHYLDTIAASARQMGMLIDDLLQFSRTGRGELQQEKIDMNQALQEALSSMQETCSGRAIEWVIGDLPQVRGDFALLRQVWTNLLENAVKYTRIRESARIEVGYFEADGEIVFFVADNGVGFDMQYADKLFGVFQRLHPQEEFEGTGIGLASVQRIISSHGGRAWAESEPERGARFYFSLCKAEEEPHG